MPFTLPQALQTSHDNAQALGLLRRYFKPDSRQPLGVAFSGARFDTWDSARTRADDADRFTADDVVAVSLLSVRVSPHAAGELLTGPTAQEINALLEDVGPDRDLITVKPEDITQTWPAWKLHDRLRRLRDVDWVIAGKLIARKRPRLVPIYDRRVRAVTGHDPNFWKPLCAHLRASGNALHHRLLRLRAEAKIDEAVSALRVFDAIAWMEGRDRGY